MRLPSLKQSTTLLVVEVCFFYDGAGTSFNDILFLQPDTSLKVRNHCGVLRNYESSGAEKPSQIS
jgi:hypothetical protein